jgi:hypothetical protein
VSRSTKDSNPNGGEDLLCTLYADFLPFGDDGATTRLATKDDTLRYDSQLRAIPTTETGAMEESTEPLLDGDMCFCIFFTVVTSSGINAGTAGITHSRKDGV